MLAAFFAASAPASAAIAVLANGQTLKVEGHRLEEGLLVLRLRGGGEIGLSPEDVRGLVPDEVIDEISAGGDDIEGLARETAVKYGLDPDLVLAVVSVESNFQSRAVSSKGAQGLMQLMPQTAAELGVPDSFDPAANLDGGTRYLQALLAHYRGDVAKALAAYNAGVGAVARHGGVPPYRETREYVKRVMGRYGKKKAKKP